MYNIHVDHGRLARRVHSAVYETCQSGSPLLSVPLSSTSLALRDLRSVVYQSSESVDRHLRDELRHA